jgi:hypothetical protein
MAAEASTLGSSIPSRLMGVAQSAVADLRGGDLYGLKVSLDSTLQNDLGLDSRKRAGVAPCRALAFTCGA